MLGHISKGSEIIIWKWYLHLSVPLCVFCCFVCIVKITTKVHTMNKLNLCIFFFVCVCMGACLHAFLCVGQKLVSALFLGHSLPSSLRQDFLLNLGLTVSARLAQQWAVGPAWHSCQSLVLKCVVLQSCNIVLRIWTQVFHLWHQVLYLFLQPQLLHFSGYQSLEDWSLLLLFFCVPLLWVLTHIMV